MLTLGSWINEQPVFDPGGKSPVVKYFKHSIIVYNKKNTKYILITFKITKKFKI